MKNYRTYRRREKFIQESSLSAAEGEKSIFLKIREGKKLFLSIAEVSKVYLFVFVFLLNENENEMSEWLQGAVFIKNVKLKLLNFLLK